MPRVNTHSIHDHVVFMKLLDNIALDLAVVRVMNLLFDLLNFGVSNFNTAACVLSQFRRNPLNT